MSCCVDFTNLSLSSRSINPFLLFIFLLFYSLFTLHFVSFSLSFLLLLFQFIQEFATLFVRKGVTIHLKRVKEWVRIVVLVFFSFFFVSSGIQYVPCFLLMENWKRIKCSRYFLYLYTYFLIVTNWCDIINNKSKEEQVL